MKKLVNSLISLGVIIYSVIGVSIFLPAHVAQAGEFYLSTRTATGMTTSSAIFRGRVNSIVSGPDVNVWFEYSTDPAVVSAGNGIKEIVSGTYGMHVNFEKLVSGLSTNTIYTYRACGESEGVVACAGTNTFKTVASSNNTNPNNNEPVVIETVINASQITTNSATIRGTVASDGIDPITGWFYLSTDHNLVNTKTAPKVFASGTYVTGQTFVKNLTNLTHTTQYWFRACGTDSSGSEDCGEISWFKTLQGQGQNPTPSDLTPVIDTKPATQITNNSAKLGGNVTSEGDAPVKNTLIKISKNSNLSNAVILNVAGSYSTGDMFFVTAYGLEENTTYYHQACGSDNDGDDDCGDILSFKTGTSITTTTTTGTGSTNNNSSNSNSSSDSNISITNNNYNYVYGYENDNDNDHDDDDDNGDLRIETQNASQITQTMAVLNGEVDDEGYGDVQVWFEFDRTRSNVSSGRADDTFYVSGRFDQGDDFDKKISGLRTNTTYYFRACGEDDRGDEDCGSVRSFRTGEGSTIETDLPNVLTSTAQNITTSSAQLQGFFNANGCNIGTNFQYGTNANNLNLSTAVENNGNTVGVARQYITGLSANTRYYYRITGTNCVGTVNGQIYSFVTKTPVFTPKPPVYTPPKTPVTPKKPTTETKPKENDCGCEIDINIDEIREQLGLGALEDRVINLERNSGSNTGSLIMVTVGNNRDMVTPEEQVTYTISWKNLSSQLEVEDIDLYITIPEDMIFVSADMGRYNKSDHALYVDAGDLDPRESNQMSLVVNVRNGIADGEMIVMQVLGSYNHPLSGASESVIDFDADEYNNIRTGVALNTNGTGVFPGSFWGWVLLILVLILIYLLIRYYYYAPVDSAKATRKETVNNIFTPQYPNAVHIKNVNNKASAPSDLPIGNGLPDFTPYKRGK